MAVLHASIPVLHGFAALIPAADYIAACRPPLPAFAPSVQVVFLQGCAGTGKTLCCTHAMFSRYSRATQALDEDMVPNVAFVTQSPVACAKAAEQFAELLATHGPRMRHVPTALAELPWALDAASFPMFTTYRRLLAMVDGVLQKPFFPRAADGSAPPCLTHYVSQTAAHDCLAGERACPPAHNGLSDHGTPGSVDPRTAPPLGPGPKMVTFEALRHPLFPTAGTLRRQGICTHITKPRATTVTVGWMCCGVTPTPPHQPPRRYPSLSRPGFDSQPIPLNGTWSSERGSKRDNTGRIPSHHSTYLPTFTQV